MMNKIKLLQSLGYQNEITLAGDSFEYLDVVAQLPDIAFSEQEFLNKKLQFEKEEFKDRLDIAAGEARSRFIPPGSEIIEEYRLMASVVMNWRDAGSDVNNSPEPLSEYAELDGLTIEQAAKNIEIKSQFLESKLLQIRSVRLEGKKKVDVSDNPKTTADEYINILNEIA